MSFQKYPRTLHLPFSQGVSSDDKVLGDLAPFEGKDVVVTLKMDGENTSLYTRGFHARSLDGRHHPSRDWLKAYHATFAHDIPEGWRICGENLYARHSIAYEALPSYFMGFSVWDENNQALSWDDTLEFLHCWASRPCRSSTGVLLMPRSLSAWLATGILSENEGFVVRAAGPIRYEDFGSSVAKWVRPAHVQTDEHWMHAAIVPNKLAAQEFRHDSLLLDAEFDACSPHARG